MTFSTALSGALYQHLFPKYKYVDGTLVCEKPTDAAKLELARKTWAVHGVCIQCMRRTISCGRCAECAIQYGEGTDSAREKDVAEQCDIARAALRRAMRLD